MSIIEKFLGSIEIKDEILFSAIADIDDEGQFGKQWLIITQKEILVFTADGSKLRKIGLESLKSSDITTFVGGDI